MNCYLIVSQITPDEIKSAFSEHMQVMPNVWVVAGRQSTCAEVCEVLGIAPPSDHTPSGNTGLVLALGQYYGYFDRALWEKVEAWQRTNP